MGVKDGKIPDTSAIPRQHPLSILKQSKDDKNLKYSQIQSMIQKELEE